MKTFYFSWHSFSSLYGTSGLGNSQTNVMHWKSAHVMLLNHMFFIPKSNVCQTETHRDKRRDERQQSAFLQEWKGSYMFFLPTGSSKAICLKSETQVFIKDPLHALIKAGFLKLLELKAHSRLSKTKQNWVPLCQINDNKIITSKTGNNFTTFNYRTVITCHHEFKFIVAMVTFPHHMFWTFHLRSVFSHTNFFSSVH